MDLGNIGPGIALALACIGSAIGCAIAGMAAHGYMSQVEEGHGKIIGLAVLPSTQAFYGFILMLFMKNKILAGTLQTFPAFGIGLFIGLAILTSSIYQGRTIATAIQATAKQPGVFGKSSVTPLVVESISIFAFIFALLII